MSLGLSSVTSRVSAVFNFIHDHTTSHLRLQLLDSSPTAASHFLSTVFNEMCPGVTVNFSPVGGRPVKH